MNTDEPSEPCTPEPINQPLNQPETPPHPPLPPRPLDSPPAPRIDATAGVSGRPVVVRPVNLADIRCDAGTQIRAGITEEVVSEYAERMLAGDKFPPPDIFFDGREHYLADGFHRVLAAGRAKLAAFQCTVHPGSLSDALWFAIGANRKNGLQRNAGDKQHAIEVALTKFPDKTQDQVAQHVGCSQQYVATVQNQLTTSCKLELPPVRKGKDGRSRPTKYKSKKKAKTPEIQPTTPLPAPATPTPAPGTASASLPKGSKEDFSTVVKIKFDKWMGQWAAADFPKVRSILRELVKE